MYLLFLRLHLNHFVGVFPKYYKRYLYFINRFTKLDWYKIVECSSTKEMLLIRGILFPGCDFKSFNSKNKN